MAEPFKPHHRVTRAAAQHLNELADTVSALTRIGEGQFGVDGVQPDPPQIYPTVRITGVEQAPGGFLHVYSCQVIQFVSVVDDTLPHVDDLHQFTLEAYEVHNNGAVPVDGSAIVKLFPQPDGGWFFEWDDETIFAVLETEGTDAKYAWVEVWPTAGGFFDEVPGGRSGTTTLNFARERNGGTGLTGRVVLLNRGVCSGYPQAIVAVATVAVDPTQHQIQSLKIVNAAAGTFTLTFFDGATSATTAAIAYNANAAALEAALELLANITAVTVTGLGTDASPFLVEMLDSYTEYAPFIPNSLGLGDDQIWSFDGKVGLTGPVGPVGPSGGQRGLMGPPGTDAASVAYSAGYMMPGPPGPPAKPYPGGQYAFWHYMDKCVNARLGRWKQLVTLKTPLPTSTLGQWVIDEDFCIPCGCLPDPRLWYCIKCGDIPNGCCDDAVPSVLQLVGTFTDDADGDCKMDGINFPLYYDPLNDAWIGGAVTDGGLLEVRLYCDLLLGWHMVYTCEGGGGGTISVNSGDGTLFSFTCDPVYFSGKFRWEDVASSPCWSVGWPPGGTCNAVFIITP